MRYFLILAILTISLLAKAQNDCHSTLEKEIFTYLNEARTKPSVFADKYLIKQQTEIEKECYLFMKAHKALEPLELSCILYKAAKFHVDDTGIKGLTIHESSDGTSFSARLKKYLPNYSNIAENIDFGNNDALSIVLSLLIDDGVPSRGHRLNIMGSDFKIIGISVGNHKTYNTMCVMDFANVF
jgi:hypothetical protein